jgi:hypothetical protein
MSIDAGNKLAAQSEMSIGRYQMLKALKQRSINIQQRRIREKENQLETSQQVVQNHDKENLVLDRMNLN